MSALPLAGYVALEQVTSSFLTLVLSSTKWAIIPSVMHKLGYKYKRNKKHNISNQS